MAKSAKTTAGAPWCHAPLDFCKPASIAALSLALISAQELRHSQEIRRKTDFFASGFNWFYSSLSTDAEVLSEWRHISAVLQQAQLVVMS